MKMWKRGLSLALGLLVLLGALAGCGGPSGSQTDSAASADPTSTAAAVAADTAAADPNAEKLELSLAMWNIQDGFDDPNAQNDVIYNDLCKKFNITIKPVQVTWNDWQDKYKIWAASNQLPDLFADEINRADYTAWANQGVIKALPGDLSKYPNIQKIMSLDSVKPWAIDGKYYKFPRMTYDTSDGWANNRNLIYRKDWAKQAGFDGAPKSFEEFMTMTKAVMAQHPDSVGVSAVSNGFLMGMFLGYFPEAASADSVWVHENDKWMPAYASERFAQGLVQFRKLYTDGVLDKDFAIQKDSDGAVKFFSGKSFAYFGDTAVAGWNNYGETFKKSNPGVKAEDAIAYMDIWPATDGNKYYFATTPYWSSTFFRADLDEKKFDRALQLLDYMYSEEYGVLSNDGIEGTDYKIENGKYVSILGEGETIAKKYPITSKIFVLSRWSSDSIGQTGKLVVSSDPDKAYLDQYNLDTLKEKQAARKPMPVNFDIMLMSTPEKDKIASIGSACVDDMLKVILGKDDPVKMWNDVLKSYEAKGLTKAIDEVTAEAAKQGIN
jgi:putative aldouronate transport system substrate-binding protein